MVLLREPLEIFYFPHFVYDVILQYIIGDPSRYVLRSRTGTVQRIGVV